MLFIVSYRANGHHSTLDSGRNWKPRTQSKPKGNILEKGELSEKKTAKGRKPRGIAGLQPRERPRDVQEPGAGRLPGACEAGAQNPAGGEVAEWGAEDGSIGGAGLRGVLSGGRLCPRRRAACRGKPTRAAGVVGVLSVYSHGLGDRGGVRGVTEKRAG